jgi:hypothetical protein
MMISDISLDGRSWLERRRDKKQVDKQGYARVTQQYVDDLGLLETTLQGTKGVSNPRVERYSLSSLQGLREN